MADPHAHGNVSLAAPLLAVRDLTVQFRSGRRWIDVVQGLSFELRAGRTVGLVGESGSGKSVTSLALAGLLSLRGGRIGGGTIHFDDQDLTQMSRTALRDLRRSRVGMIFQQPTRCLNPAYTVGDQIAEAARLRSRVSGGVARREAIRLLDRVGIPRAAARIDDYPHQFSGGMCQRVMIAIALAGEPDLLIADEPTTALDVTIQAKILELLRELQAERNMAMLLITHDLGVVADHCQDMVVVHAGEALEYGPTDSLLSEPIHPYTAGLLAALQMRRIEGAFVTVRGSAPRPGTFVPGCRFHHRCNLKVSGSCDVTAPAMEAMTPSRGVRCLRAAEIISMRTDAAMLAAGGR